MSDLMDSAVIRMPIEMAFADNLAQFQYHAKANELPDEVEALRAQLKAAQEQEPVFEYVERCDKPDYHLVYSLSNENIIRGCKLYAEPVPEDNAKLIMDFVAGIIGAYQSGFTRYPHMTLQQLHRVAQHHVKDSYGIDTDNFESIYGKELFDECKAISKAWDDQPSHIPDTGKMVDALRAAKEFIENGIEFGFIRMPEDDHDPAHKTLPMINDALSSDHIAEAGTIIIPEFLLEMSKQMREQPNRGTSHPFWQVRCKEYLPTQQGYNEHHYEIICDDVGVVHRSCDDVSGFHEYMLEHHKEWLIQQAKFYEHDTLSEALESMELDEEDLPDGLNLVYVQEVEKIVSTHLTEHDARAFMARKQHDYPEFYTYVESAYWSPQLKQLQDWIISLSDHSVDAKKKSEIPDDALQIIKSVAHIGIDFGYGKHEISDDDIKLAREIFERFDGGAQ